MHKLHVVILEDLKTFGDAIKMKKHIWYFDSYLFDVCVVKLQKLVDFQPDRTVIFFPIWKNGVR